MILAHGETVTIERPAGVTRYGDPLPPAVFTLESCGFAPRSSVELSGQRGTVIAGLVMFAPPGSDVRPVDVVIREDGTRYQVDGQPGVWRSPLTGTEAGVEVTLRRVSG